MKKYKWFADLPKEEKWLNDRLAEGFACRRIGSFGGYDFEPSGRRMVIRLDYQDHMSAEKYGEYKAIYADFGWTHLKGNRWGSVQYWQKPADGRDDIFSDAGSKLAFYKRLTKYSLTTACLFFVYTFAVFNGNIFSALFDIKASYFTSGLWEKDGAAFWRAFLFETPFAMLRFLPAWLFAICCVMSLYSYFRYEKMRKRYM